MPFPTVEFLLRNSSCKGEKKVGSWRTTDDGEDLALPIIQKKEKGFTKKTPQNTSKIRKKYWETTGNGDDALFFQR